MFQIEFLVADSIRLGVLYRADPYMKASQGVDPTKMKPAFFRSWLTGSDSFVVADETPNPYRRFWMGDPAS